MKALKLSLILMAAVLFAIGLSSTSYAFHSGGVAECEGCHTMHNSLDGSDMAGENENLHGPSPSYAGQTGAGNGNRYLLKGSDQSSTCLNCHDAPDTAPSGYHISTDMAASTNGTVLPQELTPGGDFAYLKMSYTYNVRGSNLTSLGENHGHSIIGADYGYAPSTTKGSVAPGSTNGYPVANLYCISCHDPHGRYRRMSDGTIAHGGESTKWLPIRGSGSYSTSYVPDASFAVGVYRILGGSGYQPKSITGSYAFTSEPPAAVAPGTYNRSETTTQTRVAYGRSMSEWCGNCHDKMHKDTFTSGESGAGTRHPAGNGALLTNGGINTNYNNYVKTGDMSGTPGGSYLSLIPFEEGVANHTTASYATLRGHAATNNSYLSGPNTGTENAMCLSCHRAHASAFDSMLRFDADQVEFTTLADSAGNAIYGGTDSANSTSTVARGMSQAFWKRAFYDRPATVFAPYQRALCNKCHAKD